MRFRSAIASLIILVILSAPLLVSLPSDAITHDNYEVPPGAPIPLKLEDMDKKGDVLKLTIVFKGTSSENFVPRAIDIVILDKSQADRIPRFEIAKQQGFFVRENVSVRFEEEITCPSDGQKSIMFYNHMKEGDQDDWDNATVKIKIDYHVENVKEESGPNILKWVIVFFLTAFAITAIVLSVLYFKRRSRDARMFFDTEKGAYYVFKSILDDRIYYFDGNQYSQLYNSNSLDEYDYLGTATRIGGPVMPPDNLGMEAAITTPMGEQMMLSPPVAGTPAPVDLSSMEAVPVAPPPAEPGQPREGAEDLFAAAPPIEETGEAVPAEQETAIPEEAAPSEIPSEAPVSDRTSGEEGSEGPAEEAIPQDGASPPEEDGTPETGAEENTVKDGEGSGNGNGASQAETS